MPLTLVRQDLSKIKCDAVVCPSEGTFSESGAVYDALSKAAGEELARARAALLPAKTGQVRVTEGFDLPCKWVIYAVTPVWRYGTPEEEKQLSDCYNNALNAAKEKNCASVAFPLLACGANGFPKDRAMRIAMDTIGAFLMENEMTVTLALYERAAYSLGEKVFRDIRSFIGDDEVEQMIAARPNTARRRAVRIDSEASMAPLAAPLEAAPPLEDFLREMDEGFSQTLLRKIDEAGMTDAQCYKKANIDRKLFSKIRNDPAYRPRKTTVLAFAVALEMDIEETEKLLKRAGYALSPASKFDKIVEWFIREERYDIFEINEALFAFDQNLLGG